MKFLIFLDIDGTIYSDGKIHPRTVEAVRTAHERGHKVFINSGRSLGIMPKIIMDEIKPDGIVAALGVYISIGDKILLSDDIPKENVVFAMKMADKYEKMLILEGENHSASYRGVCYLGEELEVSGTDDLYKRFPDIRVSKFTFPKRLSDEEEKELSKRFKVFNHPTYAEVGLLGYSKATGMEVVRKHFGIDKSHVIAMGDSHNDSEMLMAAGISVAMGNAPDEIKAIADFVTLDCKEGGVGYAIEKLVLQNEEE
ncbi:MAG: HAD family hydrolase [Eubacteriales bacterium]